MSPDYTIREIRLFERPVAMRLPFRFGDTVVTETAEAHVVVTVESANGPAAGQSAQLMVPRWFDKRPQLDNPQTVEELRDTLCHAARLGVGLRGTVAELSAELRAAVRGAMPPDAPDLACGFGPAVVEMALIDAACRDASLPFPDAARADLFGLVRACPADLDPAALATSLVKLRPDWRIAIRHTVGYGSALHGAEVGPRPDDGPVALDEVIAATGIGHFKIKLKGDPDADIAWLTKVAGVLDAALPSYQATLDANEQYGAEDFAGFLAALRSTPALDRLWQATLFVEQPFARDIALAADGPLPPGDMPVVIDESDDSDGAMGIALARGWAGSSVKSCKGVLRALLNRARADAARAAGQTVLLSAEDLTCQPGLCWQQDTLMAATVGARHVERNGHYFAGGFQGASEAEKSAFIAAHPDIYRATSAGPALRIEYGRVALASLNVPGFGSAVLPDLSGDRPISF